MDRPRLRYRETIPSGRGKRGGLGQKKDLDFCPKGGEKEKGGVGTRRWFIGDDPRLKIPENWKKI